MGRIKKLDRYFLEEKCPFSQKRKVKTKNLKIVAGSVLGLAIGFVLFFGEGAEYASSPAEVALKADEVPSQSLTQKSSDGSISIGGGWNSAGSLGSGLTIGGRSGFQGSARQYGASQIVRGNEHAGFGLPMGSTLSARLMNTLISSDSAQPVIAQVAEDGVWRNSVLIPVGTKAIGTASFDDSARRLQIRFHTFVYPEGDQHSVSALALLQNGSSGIPGDYHSGATQKELGRFLGNFVGGLADGMKERQVAGQAGMAFEPGSLRNGILNGITVSGLDQAKAFSEGMQNTQPYLEVNGGTPFLLYFEKEYSP